jgi:hypothetical protein
MSNIPNRGKGSGFSEGMSIQPRRAPHNGIRNFQIFKADTFTPGRLNRVNQIENAAAERKPRYNRRSQYSGGPVGN